MTFLDKFIYFFLYPVVHKMCDLCCFHSYILIISNRLQKMDLHSFILYRMNIKGSEAVDQSYGHDGTAGIDSTFKGTCFKFQKFISLSGSGPLRKDQIISPLSDLLCHLIDQL